MFKEGAAADIPWGAVEVGQYTADTGISGGTVNAVNIGGDNHGQVGAGSFTQQQMNGVDPQVFAELVIGLRSALSDLGQDDRERVDLFVRTIESEVSSARPDHGVLAAARSGLRAVADKAANKTVGVSIDMLWAYMSSKLGLPGGPQGS